MSGKNCRRIVAERAPDCGARAAPLAVPKHPPNFAEDRRCCLQYRVVILHNVRGIASRRPARGARRRASAYLVKTLLTPPEMSEVTSSTAPAIPNPPGAAR